MKKSNKSQEYLLIKVTDDDDDEEKDLLAATNEDEEEEVIFAKGANGTIAAKINMSSANSSVVGKQKKKKVQKSISFDSQPDEDIPLAPNLDHGPESEE